MDIDQVAADSNFVADIVVAVELAAADTEVVAGIVQRQDMDKYSSFDDY